MDQLWQQALPIIKENVRETSFEQFFQKDTVVDVERHGDEIYICVNDKFAKTVLEDKYMPLLSQVFSRLTNEELLPVIVDMSDTTLPRVMRQRETAAAIIGSQPVFNPRYTFDTFVVGSSNRFSHAAALAVAESPHRTYNPLFIYGGSGLGKTHLMHAIGHAVLDKQPDKKVVYISTEAFTNEFIASVRESRLDAFKAKYRSADFLLIDDIQFLAGKDRTQEEFFHTFDALHSAGKQIVISSDRPASEIYPLEERLRSRFDWGLSTDIQPPDWETRCAILQKKAFADNIRVDNEVLGLIADRIKSNVRELEGTLNKLVYFCRMNQLADVDMGVAGQVLPTLMGPEMPLRLTVSQVQKVVCDYYQITLEQMKGKKKDRYISRPRQVAMYFCYELAGASYPQIGRDFGGRDHTTALHGHERIKEARKTDPELDQALQNIEHRLLGK